MSSSEDFRARRGRLMALLPGRSVLLMSGVPQFRNQSSSSLPFRATGAWLYFCGQAPARSFALLTESGSTIYADPRSAADEVWEGPGESPESLRARGGFDAVATTSELRNAIARAGANVRALPSLHMNENVVLESLLERCIVVEGIHCELALAVVAIRLVHDALAEAELREAVGHTVEMYRAAFSATKAGVREWEVRTALEAAAFARGAGLAFASTVTVHGEVLHNASYENELHDGMLLLVDSGAESNGGYAADVTRTWPVSGTFSPEQRACYEVVLAAQHAAIAAVRPGAEQREVHQVACRVVTEGLREIGILRGPLESLLSRDVHTLFFPHGIGHLIGLDVHDMEDLGDVAGYAEGRGRDPRFGYNYLRLDRPLHPRMLVSVEPGIYFIPALLDDERRMLPFRDCIDRQALERFRGVRGIRIEDEVWVTENGCEVLTAAIPKEPHALEEALRQARNK